MKALVTGAAGFIGSHLTAALLERGAEVTGLDCFTDYYPRAFKEANLHVNRGRAGFTFVEDSLQHCPLDALLDGTTHVFHLAAQAGVRKSWGQDFRVYTDNNVDATQRLLEACVGRPLHRFVYASSSSVYGDGVSIPMREDALPQPVSPYGVTKLAAEQLCYLYHVNHRVPATSLRYFTVYGPRQRPDMAFTALVTALAEGRPFRLFGDGSARRSFTYVGDAVAGTTAAMARGASGATYNIGGGDEATMAEAIALAERIAGRPLQIERLPAAAGDVRRTKADVSRARAELGWAPATPLEDGLRAHWEWARSRVAAR